ncbi:MAG: peptidylprolyl isomerase [Mariprofundus sp.]|nr:peptidylprolyl isomerase [Mariprofundus sp.]
MSFWNRKKSTATARHILVADKAQCEALKVEIEAGADFGSVAKQHSTCPSASKGGDLGEFRQRQMVKEFDAVVFSAPLGVVHGPVKTQFGYHLIEIIGRNKG